MHPSRAMDPTHDSSLLGDELKRAIDRALQTLTPEAREVLLLSDVASYGYEDIASILGLAVGTVRSRLHRARAALLVALQAPPQSSPVLPPPSASESAEGRAHE